MYFTFDCEACGKALKVREEIAGRSARCPYCHATVTVPEPEPEPTSEVSVSGSMASRRAAAGSRRTSAKATSDGTNVSMVSSGLIGLGLAAAFMGLMLPLHRFYLGELFVHRGWVPPVLVFLLGWSVAILWLKARKLKRQKESMLFDLLPTAYDDFTR